MDTIWTLGAYAAERQVEIPGSEKNYTVRFATMEAMIRAARELVGLFGTWELQQVFCMDIDRDMFLFDAKTGSLTFRAEMNIRDRSLKLSGEQRVSFYGAPELVLGETVCETSATQAWTLAMLLFDLFYHGGHPLSGALSFSQIFMDPKEEYRWYMTDGIFNMAKDNRENGPVHGIQGHLIRYWDFYPETLQNAFAQTFLDGKENPDRRLSAKQWKSVLNEMCSAMPCDCGYGGFIDTYRQAANGNYSCPRWGKIFYALSCGERHVYISNGTRIYRWQLDPEQPDNQEVAGKVVENKQRKGVFGIKNLSDEVWKVTFPDQSEREVAKNQGAPIWTGLSISLPNTDVWSIQ